MRERTLRETVTAEGAGLQTGQKVKLTLKGAPAGSGIRFVRTDIAGSPAVDIRSFDPADTAQAERRTAVGFGALQIQTTEHLLAALAGLAVDNAVVELDNAELPALDGSAKGFVELIKKAGVAEQEAPRRFLDVREPLWCSSADALLAVFPADDFRVSYTLSYPGIGAQYVEERVDEGVFESRIAPARTFCSEAEAMELLKRGLGKGANYDNTLVMGATGPIKTTLRFPDEPARHKALDLIGDLSLAGFPLKGRVVGIKSGHKLNMEMVKKLKAVGEKAVVRS